MLPRSTISCWVFLELLREIKTKILFKDIIGSLVLPIIDFVHRRATRFILGQKWSQSNGGTLELLNLVDLNNRRKFVFIYFACISISNFSSLS